MAIVLKEADGLSWSWIKGAGHERASRNHHEDGFAKKQAKE